MEFTNKKAFMAACLAFSNDTGFRHNGTFDSLEYDVVVKPTLADFTTQYQNEVNKLMLSEIELEITPRRIREALVSDEGKTWLEAKEAEMAAVRTQIV
jgi:hypothetical protein